MIIAEQYQLLSEIGLFTGWIFFIISILLFFILKIKATVGEITGFAAKKEIQSIRNKKRENNFQSLLTNDYALKTQYLPEQTMILNDKDKVQFEIIKSVIEIHTDEDLIIKSWGEIIWGQFLNIKWLFLE